VRVTAVRLRTQAGAWHSATLTHPVSVVCVLCRYYSCLGRRQLADVFELAGGHVDGVKFAGGSFMVMPEAAVLGLTQLCHHEVAAGREWGKPTLCVQCECC
jgi:phosphosulfolactate synthase (CoM biosynthesis protein A)